MCHSEVPLAFKNFANNDVRKVDIDRHTPGPDEVLVRILAAGVCGTHFHIYTHGEWIGKSPVPEVSAESRG
jgi:threonine dehydrogenase-like Zn-dependent dehydrogenase